MHKHCFMAILVVYFVRLHLPMLPTKTERINNSTCVEVDDSVHHIIPAT